MTGTHVDPRVVRFGSSDTTRSTGSTRSAGADVSGFSMADAEPDDRLIAFGPRVHLRPLTIDHADQLALLADRNTEALAANGLAIADAEEHITNWMGSALYDLGYEFGVFIGEELVGEAVLGSVQRSGARSALLSLWLDGAQTAQGVAPEVFVLLSGIAFDALALHRIEIGVLPDNRPVQRALDKLGVPCRGLEERWLPLGDEWRDHLRYVWTADDWQDRGDDLAARFLTA